MRLLRRIRDNVRRNEITLVVSALIVLLLLAFFWPYFITVVPAGSAGVVWSRIVGTRTHFVAGEGLHVRAPWSIVTIYDLRYQTIDSDFTVLTQDGLEIEVRVTTRYRPIERELTNLHQRVGPEYVKTIVVPEVGTAVRLVAGQFQPEQFYSVGLTQLQERVVEVSRERVRSRYVEVDDVFIRSIVMPRIVAEAIQRKIEQEQASLTMAHRLDRERQEADRKRIEAEGIRDFQTTIAGSLTNQYLRYKGIEATLHLAQSPNAKIVVVGSGPGGLPLIFNAESLGPGGAVAPAPTPGPTVPKPIRQP